VNHLIACTGCDRHVRASESVCPFCGEALPVSRRGRSPRLPTERLGRAATFVFGAAVATSAAIGCGDGTSDTDAGPGGGADSGFDAGSVAPPYGIPPEDSGPGDEDAGPGGDDAGAGDEDAGPGDEDAGTDAGVDAGFDAGNIAPPYGLPPDDGGAAPLYGAPP